MSKEELWESLPRADKEFIWRDVIGECNGLSADQLEDILEDSEYLKSIADMSYPLSQTKIRRFIEKAIKQVRLLEEQTGYEEVFNFEGGIP